MVDLVEAFARILSSIISLPVALAARSNAPAHTGTRIIPVTQYNLP
ncbi:MAG TPA: hypothetical protein VD966_08260 [Pyrinomonadaceae bacterium]|nr:hypothetical protein [Pyrinomonadaceae bacterium]